jgi:hypothetical protein
VATSEWLIVTLSTPDCLTLNLEIAVSYGLLSGFAKIRRVNSRSVHLPNQFTISNHIQ